MEEGLPVVIMDYGIMLENVLGWIKFIPLQTSASTLDSSTGPLGYPWCIITVSSVDPHLARSIH